MCVCVCVLGGGGGGGGYLESPDLYGSDYSERAKLGKTLVVGGGWAVGGRWVDVVSPGIAQLFNS